MFLFSGRGYWQELIESIVWAHNKLKVAPAIPLLVTACFDNSGFSEVVTLKSLGGVFAV